MRELKKSLAEQRIYHAYIFEGPDGIGKRTLADTFCKAIFCASREDVPCGRCDACRRFDADVHPDYKVIMPQKNVISIEQIRDLIEDIYKKPYISDRKVYLLSDAQTMTMQAQNALLKTLEEPPIYSVIILLTTNIDSLLPTVTSRCLIYKLKPLSASIIERVLIERFGVPSAVARSIAPFSDGVIGKALAMAKDDVSQMLRQNSIENLRSLIERRWDVLFSVESFFIEHKDDVDFILNCWADEIRGKILQQRTEPLSGFTLIQWSSIMEYIDAARRAIASNANCQLAVDVLLLGILEVMDNAHSGRGAI